MELINREDVRREIQYSFDLGAFAWRDGQYLMDRINALPTIDAVPVQHGEWIEISDDPLHGLKKCSNCGELSCCLANYCPDCGAKMDGERREG